MSTKTFRTLLLISLALTAVTNTLDALFPELLLEPHRAAVEAQTQAGLGGHAGAWLSLFVMLQIAGVISAAGLWCGARWGAWLGVSATLVGLFAMPLLGSYVLSDLALSIAQLAVGLWFVVLASALTGLRKQPSTLSAA